ncbi:MAG: aldose epimerase family protein [Planctomycetota bacterium]
MTERIFGTLPDGRAVPIRTLKNQRGVEVDVIAYGGTITRISMPDRAGRMASVALGFDRLEPYLKRHPYFGCIVGRIAGRVTAGRLLVDGTAIQLALNNGKNHLHGGVVGFDQRLWAMSDVPGTSPTNAVQLSYTSPHGEEGYPGTVAVVVTYSLDDTGALTLDYVATGDRPTPLSLTNHTYFNLAGEGSGRIDDHHLSIAADQRVPPLGAEMTLSGKLVPVAGTPADLRRPRRLGDVIPHLDQQHGDNYCIARDPNPAPIPVAWARDPQSGRTLEVLSTEPALQFYSGVMLDGSCVGPSGRAYGKHTGFCLESQRYPDGSTRPDLGDIMVRPGRPYHQRTVFRFTIS